MGFKPRGDTAPHRFRARIFKDERTGGRAIQLPFDPRASFGRTRSPVVVSIGKGSFRSTTAVMGGLRFIPLSRRSVEETGIGEATFADVTVALDTEPRTVKAPRDLTSRLESDGLVTRWERLSYTHQREHIEAIEKARKPETRQRRIEKTATSLAAD